ncbi:MAG: SDR family NAD(P)-dependent oxidoreductase [Acidobacteria bacterium]|nr:SDR family NAD(P)-dependent oxidoreductase [Acidobacteriota bacterium]
MKQVVFITGASSGIGYALAQEFAPKGCALALAARRTDLLEALCEQVRRAGSESVALPCDVSEQSQVKQAVVETLARFGRIDLAILSAGISGSTNAADFNAESLERLLRTNLLGVAYCLEELLPVMQRQGGGTIAAISSLAGDRGFPGSAGYCATKAALSTLFDGLRVELNAQGIRLVTIEPGYVRTPMTESFGNMPFMMGADEAARLIVRRLEQGDRVIRFPLAASAFMKLMRILPVSLFDRIAARRRPIRVN